MGDIAYRPRRARPLALWLLAFCTFAGAESAYAQFTTSPVTSASVGRPYIYEVAAQGQGNVEITAPSGLPPWLTLTRTGNGSATLAGTPTQPGVTYTVALRAEDTFCRTFLFFCATQVFNVDVGFNASPTVVPPGLPDRTAAVGTPFELAVAGAFTDADGDPLTFSVTGLPPSLAFANDVIAGTPTAADGSGSPYTVTVTASDGRGGTVSDSLVITWSPNGTPTVVPPGIADQTATEGSAFNLDARPAFTDPDGEPLTLRASGLPQGFALANGVIAGTPSAATAASSPYNVTVTAEDGRGGSVADTFVLTVVGLDRADVLIESVTATPAPAVRNAAVEWTVQIANRGPSPSGSVDVTLEFSGTPFTFAGNTCTLSVEADRQRLVCTVAPIASGAAGTVKVTGSAAQPGDVWVTASITTPTAVPIDPNTANNTGSGSLNVGEAIVTEAAQVLTAVAAPLAVAAADVNGDGFADAAVGAAGAAPALLLNTDAPGGLNAALAVPGDARRGLSGTALEIGAAAQSNALVFADLDNDGDADLVVANGPSVASAAYRNVGGGAFELLADLGGAAANDRSVAVADMNGDGFIDIVISSTAGNRLYTNQGGTAFSGAQVATANGRGALDVVLTDALGSALPDLVLVYEGGPTVLHENRGGGTFGPAATIDAAPAVGAAAADFNGDGYADLVLARAAPGPSGLPSNPVYVNNRAGGFVAAGALGASPTAKVLAGDLDGNGTADVLAVNATGAHQIFLGDGSGAFRLHTQLFVSRGARSAAIAPIGLIQSADLVFVRSDGLDVFFNDGAGRLGLGDTGRPVITLAGAPEVTIEVESPYQDPGATASDDIDGPLTPAVDNPVNSLVIGTYTVTFTAVDKAGNVAAPVTRTVKVTARAAESGGGGGAMGFIPLALLAAMLGVLRLRGRRDSARASTL